MELVNDPLAAKEPHLWGADKFVEYPSVNKCTPLLGAVGKRQIVSYDGGSDSTFAMVFLVAGVKVATLL